jgi:hypothetical protein
MELVVMMEIIAHMEMLVTVENVLQLQESAIQTTINARNPMEHVTL